MRFHKKYLWTTLFLFLIEMSIAVWVSHWFIRGFIGDVLVVLLLFCFLKIFIKTASEKIAIWVILIAFCIEFLQFLKLSERLQVTSETVKIIIGNTFDVWDLIAYGIGGIIIILFTKFFRRKTH